AEWGREENDWSLGLSGQRSQSVTVRGPVFARFFVSAVRYGATSWEMRHPVP
ncbi:hypothetical protein ILYODFUR_017548, partial [Ilyodon furcidens]